jgi:hypothetical protein
MRHFERAPDDQALSRDCHLGGFGDGGGLLGLEGGKWRVLKDTIDEG